MRYLLPLIVLLFAGCAPFWKRAPYYETAWVTDETGCVYSHHKFPPGQLQQYEEAYLTGDAGPISGPFDPMP